MINAEYTRFKHKLPVFLGIMVPLFILFFIFVPITTVQEDRGGGRIVEMGKTLVQILFAPAIDIEIDVNQDQVFCTQVYQPVCGINARTYSNSCYAMALGIDVAHEGECDPNAGVQQNIFEDLAEKLYGGQ